MFERLALVLKIGHRRENLEGEYNSVDSDCVDYHCYRPYTSRARKIARRIDKDRRSFESELRDASYLNRFLSIF